MNGFIWNNFNSVLFFSTSNICRQCCCEAWKRLSLCCGYKLNTAVLIICIGLLLCNLIGFPQSHLLCLECVLRAAARLISRCPKLAPIHFLDYVLWFGAVWSFTPFLMHFMDNSRLFILLRSGSGAPLSSRLERALY